jgi:hypothetical protein
LGWQYEAANERKRIILKQIGTLKTQIRNLKPKARTGGKFMSSIGQDVQSIRNIIEAGDRIEASFKRLSGRGLKVKHFEIPWSKERAGWIKAIKELVKLEKEESQAAGQKRK